MIGCARSSGVPLPPYHPATPEMKHDWAQYYDKVEDMDTWIGKKLKGARPGRAR